MSQFVCKLAVVFLYCS